MAREPKIPQYNEFNRRNNCFGPRQQHDHNLANWRQPNRPLMVEIGAGRARISVEFARANPDWQVLAVDLKSDRLNKAARGDPAANLAFLQSHVDRLDDQLDLTGRVSLIWLAFPDPQAANRQLKHRLLSPARLDLCQRLLVAGGRLRLKTDHRGFFDDSRRLFASQPDWQITACVDDLGPEADYPADVLTQTAYETKFRAQGRLIYYLEVRGSTQRPSGLI